MEETPPLALVADASVLIDIADANETVLALIAQHVSRVIVPTPVLAEVDTLDELKCAALGLEVVEPTLDQLQEAAVPHPARSFADKICLIVARDAAASCLTNDGPLGVECEANGVPRIARPATAPRPCRARRSASCSGPRHGRAHQRQQPLHHECDR